MLQYIPFDDTHVIYDSKDHFGLVAVHLTLLPIYVMVFYTSWFIINREIEPVIAVAGQLANDILNKILKILIKQSRPDFHKAFGSSTVGMNYGMPSAHSQFMGFFATYYIVLTWKATSSLTFTKLLVSLGLLSAAVGVAYSRFHLMYHTLEQVVMGVLCGSSAGLIYAMVSLFARDVGLVDWVLLWPIVRFFWIKDSYYHNYRLYQQEWQEVEDAKRKKCQ